VIRWLAGEVYGNPRAHSDFVALRCGRLVCPSLICMIDDTRSFGRSLAALPLYLIAAVSAVIVIAVGLVFLVAATLVLAVASLFRPDLRRVIVGLWRAGRAARAYRRWQRGPTVEGVDIDPVDRG